MSNFSEKIQYKNLSANQKEIYNFQKVSACLADYGYTTIKLDDDWMGADFIAVHIDGLKYLKVQLKGRFTFDKKYRGKDIFICFFDEKWIIYPHDELLKIIEPERRNTKSWIEKGCYHYPYLTTKNRGRLKKYSIN